MDTTQLHPDPSLAGLTGSVQAGVGPAPAKPSSSGGGIPNIFDPSFWGAFGTKQSTAGRTLGTGVDLTGAARTVAHPTSLFSGVQQVIENYGLRLLQLLAGAVLVIFGLATLAKGDTPSLGPVALGAIK